MKKTIATITLLLLASSAKAECAQWAYVYLTRPDPGTLVSVPPDRSALFSTLALSIREKGSLPTTSTYEVKNARLCTAKSSMADDFPDAVAVGFSEGRTFTATLTEEQVIHILRNPNAHKYPNKTSPVNTGIPSPFDN